MQQIENIINNYLQKKTNDHCQPSTIKIQKSKLNKQKEELSKIVAKEGLTEKSKQLILVKIADKFNEGINPRVKIEINIDNLIKDQKVDFEKIFNEEKSKINESVENIPHFQKEQLINKLENNNIVDVIQKTNDGTNLRITDIINDIQNINVIVDILTNVFEILIKNNSLFTPGNAYQNVEKFYYMLDNEFIIDQNNLSRMITEYVNRVLNFNQEKYQENLDEEHFTNFIKIDFIVEYKRGGKYIYDKAFEDIVREALVLVKNRRQLFILSI